MISNLKKIMKDKKVTVRNLSEKTGISIQTIMNARDNKKICSCSLGKLQKIARALDCKVKDLFIEDEK